MMKLPAGTGGGEESRDKGPDPESVRQEGKRIDSGIRGWVRGKKCSGGGHKAANRDEEGSMGTRSGHRR